MNPQTRLKVTNTRPEVLAPYALRRRKRGRSL
jgi:hypothetical protein